jgi:transcriptional regulator with XRE-family HTH domain
MHHIQAGQIKAARAMLDWTREDLAVATGLSPNTIRNLEAGIISPRHATNSIIRQVLERKGLEFTDHEGVRRRPIDLLLHRGHDSCDKFFDDLLQTIKQRGGDVLAVCTSPAMLLQSVGASERNLERLEQLSAAADVKCLLADYREPPFALPSVQFRVVSKLQVYPSGYYVFGDRIGFVMAGDGVELRFMVVQDAGTARHWGGHFLDLWNDAVPLSTPVHARRA